MSNFVDVVEQNLTSLVKGVEAKISEGYRFTDGNDTNVFDFKTYLHATLAKAEGVKPKVDLGEVNEVTLVDYDIVGIVRQAQDAILQGFTFRSDHSVPGVYYSLHLVRAQKAVEAPVEVAEENQDTPAPAVKRGRKPSTK
jgi:hypothetical protein